MSSRPTARTQDWPRRSRHAWPDERIRAELRRFLGDRPGWPTYREFQGNGLKSLRDAITHTGGAEHWAKDIGVSFVKHRPGYETVWTEDGFGGISATIWLGGRCGRRGRSSSEMG